MQARKNVLLASDSGRQTASYQKKLSKAYDDHFLRLYPGRNSKFDYSKAKRALGYHILYCPTLTVIIKYSVELYHISFYVLLQNHEWL